jgi:ATP-dependent helicase/DNAse subunit B
VSKQIWLSPVLGNSRERLVERCAEMIKRGDSHRFLYLTASHPLLELVTKWILDFDTIRGVMGTLPVFLFRGFVRHVLTTAVDFESGLALTKRTPIDGEESNLKKSLLSQIMRRLVVRGDLKALAPLANRDGTVNTIATLIGEIQRAAKRPDEFRAIIETRAGDLNVTRREENEIKENSVGNIPQQRDFDREIGTIYEEYSRVLDRFQLTEADADQLRALQVVTGEVDSRQVTLHWLDQVELLILDGFFDFTPVQGEILKRLIPTVPNVVVNLYGDQENVEVFSPFADTVEQLSAMSGDFEVVQHRDSRHVGNTATVIRKRLFNSVVEGKDGDETGVAKRGSVADVGGRDARAPSVLRCSDRETEIREIAKVIKRLVLEDNFSIREVALVVRQRASYAETIARVFAEENIPCTIERSQNLADVPAIRAVLKLFQILKDKRDAENPRVTDLADLIKSGYFRLSDESIRALLSDSGTHQADLPGFESDNIEDSSRRLRNISASTSDQELTSWNPDEIENVIAYVGSELRLDRWLERARQLASNEAFAGDVRLELFGDDTTETDDIDETYSDEDPSDTPKPIGQKSVPPREIPPWVLKWASILIREFASTIQMMPREDEGANLSLALLKLLDELQFAQTTRHSMADLDLEETLPHAAIELRALSGLRQAIAAAIKSIEISTTIIADEENRSTSITVEDLITEIERCIGAQTLAIAGADRDGLQVLEATDVRGLQFRAIFIAGLIEGGFPLRKPRDWIYPHEERERLKQYGLTLEDISPATLLKEEHYFYQAACRATERLYLTWPLVLEGGEETVVSYYIDEVAHALAPLEMISQDKRRDFDGDGVLDSSSRAELAASLVRLDERHKHRGRKSVRFSRDVVDKLLAWAEDQNVLTQSARKRIAIGRERIGERYGRYDGLITHEDLQSLLAKRFGADYVWSASALSLYGKSPFKFFAERVLKLERRIEAALDLTAMDAGGLLHEALRRFLQNHRGVRLKNTDRAKLREEMLTITDKVFSERERAVPPLNIHVWKLDREMQQLQLAQVVEYEIDLQNSSEENGVLPHYFELGFGMEHGIRDERSTPDFLTMMRDDDTHAATDAIRLRGQIDRVDVARDGTLIAYDYKKSQGAKEDDMLEGRDLQIGIYLDALEKVFFPGQVIAGGGYYLLRTRDRNRGLYREGFDRFTQLSSKVSSRYDDKQWLEHRATMRRRIWQFVDNIRAGRFVVNPTAPDQTCKACDFLTVCRYEKYRILKKNDAS